MSDRYSHGFMAAVCLGVLSAAMAAFAGSGDSDGNGYVGVEDYSSFRTCLEASGPGTPSTPQACIDVFDADGDGDIDLVDYAAFARIRGHLPIPLKDAFGNLITIDSTAPYSSRQTCGVLDCHDADQVGNGSHHQEGRTDADRNMIMRDDFYDDGKWWIRGSGMYGRWSGGSGGYNRQTAGKDNAEESAMDMTAFYWAGNCGACHAGGGGMEFDRSGERYYGYYDDTERFQFGYERLSLTAGDVVLDGDYAFLDDADGSLSPARWDITGVAEPECLHCHRANRTWVDGVDMHRQWREAVLGTTTELVDDQQNPVQAFAAAGTAGQGWFSTLDTDANPPVLQIDYSVGVNDGSLLRNLDDTLSLPQTFLRNPPADRVCWGCHQAGGAEDKRGMIWFDERDVHFKKLTNRSDEEPGNDIADEHARACTHCHTGDVDHNYTKGNSPYTRFRDELDWVGFKSCRECHLYVLPDGSLNPDKDPDAPEVPGILTVHITGFFEWEERGMARSLSCQACHMPYALEPGVLVTDWSLTGTALQYHTDEFLSADPRNPSDADKSKWYPALRRKMDSDGLERFFPQKMEIAIYWADWDWGELPEDTSDDTIQPIILWRLKQFIGNEPLTGVTDDNDDTKLEINRPEEILLYIQALKKGTDTYGQPIANNPVLVKGPRVWYEDPQTPGEVSWFDSEESDIVVEPFEVYGLDHNVLPATESWGVGGAEECSICHDVTVPYESPFIDRLFLIDPFDENGDPVYRVNRTDGLNPIY